MPKMKRCPFCGCSMTIRKFIYRNGDEGLEPDGAHQSGCILDAVIWNTDPADGWTEDEIIKAWNCRWKKGERK